LHLTLVRTAVIKETNNAGEDEATAFLIHCWWKCKLMNMEVSTERVLKKDRTTTFSYYATLRVSMESKSVATEMSRNLCFYSAIYNSQAIESA
jgi:hypothetical protein